MFGSCPVQCDTHAHKQCHEPWFRPSQQLHSSWLVGCRICHKLLHSLVF